MVRSVALGSGVAAVVVQDPEKILIVLIDPSQLNILGCAAILKTVESPYLCNRLTDFDEIWHNDAHWPLTADRPLKFRIFLRFKMAAAAILKITKIAISPQRFDRSLRNLVSWCEMGLLTALTVKKFEFHKSKMAEGRHFENR